MSESNQHVLREWFKGLSTEDMEAFLRDEQAVQGWIDLHLSREDLFSDEISGQNIPVYLEDGVTPDPNYPEGMSVDEYNRLNRRGVPDYTHPDDIPWYTNAPPDSSPIDGDDLREIYIQEFNRRMLGQTPEEFYQNQGGDDEQTFDAADFNQDGVVSEAEGAVNLVELGNLIESDEPGTLEEILAVIFGDYNIDDVDQELIDTLLGQIPNYQAAGGEDDFELTDEQRKAWEKLKKDDRGLDTVGILAGVFGPDFDLKSLERNLVNFILDHWGKNYDDFQNDLRPDDDDQVDNNNNNNNNNNDQNNNPGGNDDGGGMDWNKFLDWINQTFGLGGLDYPGDQAIIDLINIALGDQTQTTDVDVRGGDQDQTTDVDTDVDVDAQGGQADATATGGSVGDTTATGGSVGDTTATAAGGAGGQGGQATAAGGAGGQGGIGQGGAGGIGQGGAGGSVEGVTTGDLASTQTIGDTIFDAVTNIIQDPIDVVGAGLIEEAWRRYQVDQLRDAADAELALLRELMKTRADVYYPFYTLGGDPGPDGTWGTADDVSFTDTDIDRYRSALLEEYEPRIDLADERGTGQLVDVQPNRFDIAQMVSEIGRGAIPDAIFTDVNQINPFNPDDPALRFLQDEGRRAIEASAAAQGRLNTGGTLQELMNQAIGTAAQYSGQLADIGRTQDQTRLSRDQQFYNQLFGGQEQEFGQDLKQLEALQQAQTAADKAQLEAEASRFESGQQIGQQGFAQARDINQADLGLANRDIEMANMLMNLSGKVGAPGIVGGDTSYLGAGYGQSAGSPYHNLGQLENQENVWKQRVLGNVIGSIFG